MRILLGSRIRHALRGKDAPSRLFAILALMRGLERHVARVLRRLRCGVTRLRPILPAPHDAAPFMLFAFACIAFTNTS